MRGLPSCRPACCRRGGGGSLPLARGGTASGGAGQVKPATTRKVSEIATAEEGWSVTSAQYACWGKMAMVQLVVKNTSEAASGISMPCMLPEGKRPLLSAQAHGSGKCDAQITDAGEVLLTGTVAAGASVTVLATYLLP